MITKADIEKRIAELKLESERVLAQTSGTYSGAVQELERLLSSFDTNKEESPENKENK